jgi:hypothetical protein
MIESMSGANCPPQAWRPTSWRGPSAGYGEPLLRKTVTLPVSYVEHLTTIGEGNFSEGIRWLAENACTPSGKLWLDLWDPAS